MLSLAIRRAAAAVSTRRASLTVATLTKLPPPASTSAAREFSTPTEIEGEMDQKYHAVVQNDAGEIVYVVPDIDDSLEWCLTSPPPLHQFDESPVIVETDHLVKK
uniref:Uncharacterized protein n=1 Tax=Corethron hystrix TaxID=216773 RepID=A0A7S1BKV5_9STRA|mmetsp:Transcript_29705/g.68202  ORF Transcript_29705/g.68202 Transcript_29705/m.68202 type:complete len:105 (+) Transcript_29705:149-463(+)|eukprot:CAMPEP_0113298234 /NCGR_PEP_ID=MMETSP0010_2-20120614/765_1 /TAXON_ID=216773 ORGANISM="Corethron hystrix, Strain 308" /NCGR_SAMPLE_ID=MMETSP0010_2 /ASSEMBLY_ACC=CAM_ASM_000155 /LENGTH=104 /DNA_ID=CAMNT_0000151257 /DNA_START=88 /DNA_END=402 /DNA_ORIENTATION=- /assembly_acc=CAM_ASM_000155